MCMVKIDSGVIKAHCYYREADHTIYMSMLRNYHRQAERECEWSINHEFIHHLMNTKFGNVNYDKVAYIVDEYHKAPLC